MDRMTFGDRALLLQIGAADLARRAAMSLRRTASRVARQEDGQTPTEYLMIVGFMAAVIVCVFAFWFWDEIRDQAQNWSQKVAKTVGGGNVDQPDY